MTTYSRGDIVLVKFVFADEKGVKQRPGLLVSSASYHRSRREAVLAAITSHAGRSLVGDYRLVRWKEAGLPLPSTVTGIIRTIKQDMIIIIAHQMYGVANTHRHENNRQHGRYGVHRYIQDRHAPHGPNNCESNDG